MPTNHACIHEEQIQGISRKTAELEARAEFKEKRIDELSAKIDAIDKKLDTLILQSTTDDKDLELRLSNIETKLEVQEKATNDNYVKLTLFISIVTVVFLGLTFYFNFIH